MSHARPMANGGPVKPGLNIDWGTGVDYLPLLRATSESVATAPAPVRTAVREAPTVIDSSKPGRLLVQLIRAGWSLNGSYYPAEALKRDGPKAWPAGTLNYVDHDTDAEEESRPSGSLMRLASYQTSDARWDEQRQALVAEVRVFAPWRETVADWAESGAIGMSIRAWVYGEHGEAEGRKGFVVTSIAEGRSVDYVTVPAAGGAILSVLESVQRRAVGEARNIGAWIESRLHLSLTQLGDDLYGDGRLTREERITLSSAIGEGLQAWTARVEADAPQLFTRDLWAYPEPAVDGVEEARRTAEQAANDLRDALGAAVVTAYGAKDVWTWVRDFDPDQSVVWFQVSTEDSSTLWQQAYETADDGSVSLAGDRVEVVARTVYVPAQAGGAADDTAGDDTAESAQAGQAGQTGQTAGTSPVDAAAEQAPSGETPDQDVTDGAPPTVTDPPTEEETGMSGTQTGAPPEQAGTAPVVDTPPTNDQTGAAEANRAVLEAMQALTRQVTTLSEANTALVARVDRAEANERTGRNRGIAREAVTAALNADTVPGDLRAQIAPRVTESVLANIPVTDTGDIDTAALGERITAAVAAESGYAAGLLEQAGVGRPRGLGESAAPKTGEDFVKSLEEGFRALGMSESAAKIAAQGRG